MRAAVERTHGPAVLRGLGAFPLVEVTATTAAVAAALHALDRGELRIAEKVDGSWRVNQWLKKAVLLSFRLNPMEAIPGGPGGTAGPDRAAGCIPFVGCASTG